MEQPNRSYPIWQPSNRMQSDFGELALPSAADAKRYAALLTYQI